MRRVKPENWERLERDMAALPNADLLAEGDRLAFETGRWDSAIFKNNGWPLLAFREFLEGRLREKQMVKLLLYNACQQEGPVETFTLLDQTGKLNHQALGVIEHHQTKLIQSTSIWKISKESQLLPEDTQFFKVRHRRGVQRSLFHLIHDSGVHFCLRQTEREHTQLILPPELANAVLSNQFGPHARQALPVLGYFQKELLSLPHHRPASLSFKPYILVPEEAHRFPATPLSFYQHDLYHRLVDSANIHRRSFVELAKKLKEKNCVSEAMKCLDGDLEGIL